MYKYNFYRHQFTDLFESLNIERYQLFCTCITKCNTSTIKKKIFFIYMIKNKIKIQPVKNRKRNLFVILL
jgi:hypothetical protein